MIKFFRKIRQRLLTENPPARRAGKFSKYLLYAVGEIALVMIGILLALQVNNQNELRKSNNLYKSYELNIISELKTDLLQLKERDSLIKIRIATIEDYVVYYNKDSLDMTILKTKADSTRTFLGFFSTSTYSIQDLVTTGNLKLFSTQKRNAILKYKNYTDGLAVAEFKSLEAVDKVSLDFKKEIDILYDYDYDYSKKEHSTVKNWEYNIDAPQMRLRNNRLAYYLRLYEKQGRIYKSIAKETKALKAVLENNKKG
ncbi:hypothetical protein ES692_04860 [Psychroserpens burtonensis]|uniref:Uncharacterized protein n=1 Tax=Psychroserpens burtonensis TaxID=49278 RepID=A0A5C7BGU9_9FLAO|nr:DUF6090 family protein [Psychroserpens burtonensis]TXE18785.1 hypothetical protein ES692_04860 [Psychroserpens burtonensis]